MKFGIDRLLEDESLRKPMAGKRVALLAHPASLTNNLVHSLDAIVECSDVNVTSAFGPQHGLRGDKQDNMIESQDYSDPNHGIPVFSLYGKTRRPTAQSMDTFDILLVDLQDLGCRIYTFVTTLLYVMEAAAKHHKSIWVLDRPNPAGRPVEGMLLQSGWESFVGAAPMPMRHGLTLGELGTWFQSHFSLDLDYKVIEMQGWLPTNQGYGWPPKRVWVNPSPNAPSIAMARAYAGTVMVEGTTLSEGRGTTRPLEMFGAPDINARAIVAEMYKQAPDWIGGCKLRDCWFEPTFHKHNQELCNGIHVHAEAPFYNHQDFRPWRLQSIAFKAIRRLYPDYEIWRDFEYEYETNKLAIDVINGGPRLREWVDSDSTNFRDLDEITVPEEQYWREVTKDFLIY